MHARFLAAVLVSITAVAACKPTEVPPATPPNATAEPTASAAPINTAPQASQTPVQETPPAACAGRVDAPPAGLAAADEPAPGFAIGQPGKGALCEGKVFTVKQPVTVYRVFSASYQTSKRAGPTGAYWTFQKPTGKQADYRATYGICAEWNDLDMLNECTLDVGAKVVLGPGQSAACDGGKEFPQSATNQVLVVKGADGKVPVGSCKQSPITWAN